MSTKSLISGVESRKNKHELYKYINQHIPKSSKYIMGHVHSNVGHGTQRNPYMSTIMCVGTMYPYSSKKLYLNN